MRTIPFGPCSLYTPKCSYHNILTNIWNCQNLTKYKCLKIIYKGNLSHLKNLMRQIELFVTKINANGLNLYAGLSHPWWRSTKFCRRSFLILRLNFCRLVERYYIHLESSSNNYYHPYSFSKYKLNIYIYIYIYI